MSWQAYVDSNLVGTGQVSRGAILGHDGGVWAQSATLGIGAAELQKLAQGFSNPQGVQGTGLTFAGDKYMIILANDKSIYGKFKDGGFAAAKTGQSIIVGFYNVGSGVQPGNCANTVEKLADYLVSVGY